MIIRKTAAELQKMRRSGLLVWQILHELEKMAGEGVSTLDLEVAAERMMKDAGARPAFKGYYVPAAGDTFPVRAVYLGERRDRAWHAVGQAGFEEGRHRFDRYGRAAGRLLRGFGHHRGDRAKSARQTRKLMRVTQESLELAIQQTKAGNRLFDICGTVEKHVLANGFSVVREYVGHGIGTQLHEEPQVPNYVERRNENPRLKEGMVLAIEPMVNAGKAETRVLKDKWTAVTKDGSYSAHFEHCVAVTANGPWVLTRP